ncbi:uncharacterized protein LOC116214750 [Punica granatum]|uniref:Uncharacterized protein n=2 Tax=Punica granatum TaxID=22663 RepID=A0A218WDL6_PUNGR|nr:uncharacterized protein LOC116214750 [Punica granatum]OWM70766.1 hypothetical protein CDL15_Pgr014439 [Punica granatum]PKI41704.1 hypothetical protein CRG98_037906 [Punica granatum]
MSNVITSQCSSGVESGWTLYLDDDEEHESSFSMERARRRSYGSGWIRKEEEDDDENLSMVSDASSRPPYCGAEDWSCHESGGGFVAGLEQSGKRKNKRQQGRGWHSHYEDTACSHQKNFSLPSSHAPRKHALDFQPGYSIANLEDKLEYGKQYHYLHSSGAEKPAPKISDNSRKLG